MAGYCDRHGKYETGCDECMPQDGLLEEMVAVQGLHSYARVVVHGYLKRHGAALIGNNIFDDVVADAERQRTRIAALEGENERLHDAVNFTIGALSVMSSDIARKLADQLRAALTPPPADTGGEG